jgi:hypothetical protein
MTATSRRVQDLVMQMQGAFLDTPHLSLTLADAQDRFGVDEITCDAVLGVLVDAKVLSRTSDGVYVRRFPCLVSRIVTSGPPRTPRRHVREDGTRAATKHAA